MFFSEQQRKIYTPPNSTKSYDPLALSRDLVKATEGQINKYVKLWYDADSDEGDISEEGMRQKALYAAHAEGILAKASREVFNLPPFPETLDADALTMLTDFLEWLQGKA